MDVIVVGGGVIGCATAYELAKAGASVTLVESGEVAGQASGAAAGMLIPPPWAAPGGAFRDLCRASLDLYPRLVDDVQGETGIDVEYLAAGLLVVVQTEAAAQALRQVAQWRGKLLVELEWVEGEHLRRLEPALSPRLPGAGYAPDQHHVNPGRLTLALAQAAVARGARLRQGTRVLRLLTRADRVVAVRTSAEGGSASGGSDGDIAADHVVLAAGPWTRMLARPLGVDLPVLPMRGQMLAYRTAKVRHVIWGDEGYLVPKPALRRAEGAGAQTGARRGGFLFAGATVEDVGFRPRTTARGLAGLRRMARTLVPALRSAPVASAWAGLRPGSPDGLPVLGPLPGWRNVSVASGHFRNGVLLAPITGKLIAQLVLEGRAEMPLSPFNPGRFASRTRAAPR